MLALIVLGLACMGWGIFLLLDLRFVARPGHTSRASVVLRPITIPARYGKHTFTDAEVIDRFLAVDWLLSHKDPEPARRDW